jgi:aldehyde dehydrogenase (NAD+)
MSDSNNQFQSIFDSLQAHAPVIANSTAAERIDKLQRLYKAVYDLRDEISKAGLAELGMDGRFHLLPLKAEVDFICQHLAGWMEREVVEDDPALQGRTGYIHYEPKGVVLHLATWNSPVLISLSPALAMIAAGNAVIIKPSEIAPDSAEIVCKAIANAGLADEVAVVTGGAEVAQDLLALPFNHISYVGNNRIGRLVMAAAAENFAGVTLEMGGKNPVIIAGDADIEDAAAKIGFARMIIAGQVCLAPDYILVENSVKDQFIEAMQNKIDAMFNPTGAGIESSGDFARIVNERHTNRIKALVDEAVSMGAQIAYGGTIIPEKKYVEPTIITGVTEDMEIFHEEIFGPVMFVQGYDSPAEVVTEIGKRPKPLALYVFTQNRETADWFINHTRAGTSAVNNAVIQANIPTLPFGGSNHSGIGRLGGHAGFLEFSNGRAVVEDALIPGEGTPMMYPPFPEDAITFIDMMLEPK